MPQCFRVLSALLGLAVLAAPASAQVIDDFRDGFSLLELPTMPPDAAGWLRSDTAASVPGGTRSLALRSAPGSSALSFVQVETGWLQAYRLPTQNLLASVGYGQLAPMNLDLGGQTALRVDVWWGGVLDAGTWNRDGLTLTVYANTSTGAGLNPDGSAASVTLRGSSVVDLPFSSFTLNSATGRPVDWADVDSLLFVVNENLVGGQAAGFGLLSISAVPEPGSWALMALGVAWLLAARQGGARRRAAA